MNAESLHRAGWKVKVLTTTSRHVLQAIDDTLLEGFPAEIEVMRVDSPEAAFAESFGIWGKRLVVWAGRTILPEPFFPWLVPALSRAVREVRTWKPNIIYSRAPKHVSNLVGWRLKKATGLPWVAHFSDPWFIGLTRHPLQRFVVKFLERRVIRDADALVFVTQQAADVIMRSYPAAWSRRVHIIPHGYVPLSLASNSRPQNRGGPLKVIHAGSFYPNFRSPDSLIEGIRRLKARIQIAGRLEITCVGVDTTCYQQALEKAGVADVISLRPSVPFVECQRMLAESDLILVIDTPKFGGMFLPTKLIEGFAFRKPMLGLAESNSAVKETLERCGLPCAELGDPGAIAAEFERLLARWESGQWGLDAEVSRRLTAYEIDRVNQKLTRLFHSLIPAETSM
jgi:hypothetical protein